VLIKFLNEVNRYNDKLTTSKLTRAQKTTARPGDCTDLLLFMYGNECCQLRLMVN